MPFTFRLKKSKELPLPDKQTLTMLYQFVKFAAERLQLGDTPIVLTLLQAAPPQPITTGAFSTGDGSICCIVQNRHYIDYTRTIAHEMTHLKQFVDQRIKEGVPEIGGEIEDEANYMSGRIVKEYIKSVLTPEQKKHLGLGTF